VVALAGAVVTMGLCLLLAATHTGEAASQTYNDQAGSVVIQPSTVQPGASVKVEASHLVAGGDYSLRLFSDASGTPVAELGSATAGPQGDITADVTIPTDLDSGSHRVVVVGAGKDGAQQIASGNVAIGTATSTRPPTTAPASSSKGTVIVLLVAAAVVVAGLGLWLRRRGTPAAVNP